MQIIKEKFDELYNKESEYVFDDELETFSKNHIVENKENLAHLFRYSPTDYYNIRGVETGKIHLSEIGLMNDIFEGLSGEIDSRALAGIEKLYDLAYIKSFSECNDNLRMWSSYADNYAGMCVEYDISKLEDKVLYHLFPVRYSNNRTVKNNLHFTFKELVNMKKAMQDDHCDFDFDFLKDVTSLFLTKSKDWDYEKEWRIVVSYLQLHCDYQTVENEDDEKTTKNLFDIDSQNIDFNCVEAIYLGPKIDLEKEKHLVKIGHSLNKPVYKMKLSQTEYKLEKDLLKYEDYIDI